MPHGHRLVNQSLTVSLVALATLTAQTALLINSELAAPTSTFLCKRVRYILQVVGRTAGDNGPLFVCLAHGNAAAGEVSAAITEHNPFGPEDITQSLTEDTAWVVWQDSISVMTVRGAETGSITLDSGWLKLAKNGIPALEGSGVQAFVVNAGNGSLATGSSIEGLIMIQGVWLRD